MSQGSTPEKMSEDDLSAKDEVFVFEITNLLQLKILHKTLK